MCPVDEGGYLMFGLLLFAMIIFSFVYNIRDILNNRKSVKRQADKSILKSEDLKDE